MVFKKGQKSWNRGLNKNNNSILKKISETRKGKNNPNWKGNKVGYTALHSWIKRNKPKPNFCEKCNIRKPKDLANISGKYKRDIKDYKWVCRRCHMLEDDRLKQIINLSKKNKGKSFEEIYGKEKAEEIKIKLKNNSQKGKSRTFTKEHLQKLKNHIQKRKGKSFEEIYGKEKAEEIKIKLKKVTKFKEINLKRKGKSFEEIYGKEKAKKLRLKLQKKLWGRKQVRLGE